MVESNLSELPSEKIRLAVCNTVEQILETKNHTISVTSASQSGDNNFIGIVYRVSFNKVNDKNKNDNPSKLILKVAPENAARRAQFFSRPCFLREIYMYETVLPYFREFEQSKGVIADENGFNEYPKCYRTITDEPNESVLLEDLSIRSFTMIDRFTEDVSVDHVRLVMKCLGKFHAISFALKDQLPEKFDELAAPLNEIFIRKDDKNLCDYFAKQSEMAIKVLSGENDAHLLTKVKKLFEREAMDIAASCVDTKSAGKSAIITHGDMWQNNTMFRYNNNGKPIETVLLDFQISRCSSPIIDIVYFMFCCTTKELRDAHYDEFLKIYHESLSTHIRKYVAIDII